MSEPGQNPRKRPRSKCDDGGCDFMPLSKRINNLHLDRPTMEGHSSSAFPQSLGFPPQEGMFKPPELWGNNGVPPGVNLPVDMSQNVMQLQNPSVQVQHQPQNVQASGPIHAPWMNDEMLAQYAPILDQADNPHYYENNKMLFILFMERLQRLSQV